MRIISGKGKGTKLITKKGNTTRPTADRVKEAIFSIISEKIVDSEVLDLYAGSGALGLESLSRGASFVTFCDNDKESISIIKKNIKKAHNEIDKNVNVKYIDALRFLKTTDKKFDIVFLDPPYDYNMEKVLKTIFKEKILKPLGIVIYETEKDLKEFDEFMIIDKRKYGRPYIIFLEEKKR